jgi:cell division protein FtsB
MQMLSKTIKVQSNELEVLLKTIEELELKIAQLEAENKDLKEFIMHIND